MATKIKILLLYRELLINMSIVSDYISLEVLLCIICSLTNYFNRLNKNPFAIAAEMARFVNALQFQVVVRGNCARAAHVK